MDLNTVSAVVPLRTRGDLGLWTERSAWLGGGTWLFSEPQRGLHTLLDLQALGWPPMTCDERGLRIGATCTFAQLYAFSPPPEFPALSLIETCCDALLGSFKIWNMATVGGNICLALPAAPMIAFAVALNGTGVIWAGSGGERRLPIVELVLGSQRTALAPDEVLREIELPAQALRRRSAHRRASLSNLGRSAAFLIGTRDRHGFALTITGSTRRPFRLAFDAEPNATDLADALATTIPDDCYHDDVHGHPSWRRHLTFVFAEDIRAELYRR